MNVISVNSFSFGSFRKTLRDVAANIVWFITTNETNGSWGGNSLISRVPGRRDGLTCLGFIHRSCASKIDALMRRKNAPMVEHDVRMADNSFEVQDALVHDTNVWATEVRDQRLDVS